MLLLIHCANGSKPTVRPRLSMEGHGGGVARGVARGGGRIGSRGYMR